MTLKACMEIGKCCGLTTIEECYDNICIHSPSIFVYEEINNEICELQKDIFYNDPDLFCKMFKADKNKLLEKGWKTKKEDEKGI